MSAPTRHRLLVVDDEPDLRTLYELTLLREGYHIGSAPAPSWVTERRARSASASAARCSPP